MTDAPAGGPLPPAAQPVATPIATPIATIAARTDVAFPSATVEAERLYRKQRLAVAFRIFAQEDYELGAAGHITARDPEFPDRFWVNPVMHPFSEMRVSDLLLVDHAGTVLEGSGQVNPAAFAIHSRLHAARPDVIAAAHSHSTYGKTWSAFGRLLEPLTQDAAIFYEDHVIFDGFSGVLDDLSEADRLARTLGAKNAAILQNHGILTVGQTVESAAWRFIAMEDACKVQLLAEGSGGGTPMPHDVARHTHAQLCSEMVGVFSFEPYWRAMIARQPEVLG
ncbi:MAG TPA: class II aldolase/adducin family protein [Novosphingobium sp.]